MGKPRRTVITNEQFALIVNKTGWSIDEVDPEHWNQIPGLQRLQDTFAVFASGGVDPRMLNNHLSVAGLDVLARELRPRIQQGEGEGNAYHYVVEQSNDGTKVIVGPFRSETIVPHWFDASDLDRYWSNPVDDDVA